MHEIERIIRLTAPHPPTATLVRLLLDIRADAPLQLLFSTDDDTDADADADSHPDPDTNESARVRLIAACIACAGERMLGRFEAACAQHTAHLDYLKVPVLLQCALDAVRQRAVQMPPATDDDRIALRLMPAVLAHLRLADAVRWRALRHVDAAPLERFIGEQLLGDGALLRWYSGLVDALLGHVARALRSGAPAPTRTLEVCECAELIVRHVVEQRLSAVRGGQPQRRPPADYGDAECAKDGVSEEGDVWCSIAGWLRAVHAILAHLVTRPGRAFEGCWNERGRRLIECNDDEGNDNGDGRKGKCASLGRRAIWLAQFVLMWRETAADGDDEANADDVDEDDDDVQCDDGVHSVLVSDVTMNSGALNVWQWRSGSVWAGVGHVVSHLSNSIIIKNYVHLLCLRTSQKKSMNILCPISPTLICDDPVRLCGLCAALVIALYICNETNLPSSVVRFRLHTKSAFAALVPPRVQSALVAIAERLLQTPELYAYAIMPDEMDGNADNDCTDDDGAPQDERDERPVHRQPSRSGAAVRLPSIPIERLNDVGALEEFVRR